MKIIYENNEVKQSCQNKYVDLNSETILKYFGLILGKKIRVFDYSCNEHQTKTMKVENLRDNSIKNVTIEYDNRTNHSFGVSHLVTITEEDLDMPLTFGRTYEIGSHFCRRSCDNYYNQENGLLIEEIACINWINSKTYVLKNNDKICEFTLRNVESDPIFRLLEFTSLDLKDVYEALKEIDDKYVQKINISVEDCQSEETESLHIIENNLYNYQKTYQKDGHLITIVYQDGKIYVTTKQELSDNDVIKTRAIDVTDELNKVKRLFRHK